MYQIPTWQARKWLTCQYHQKNYYLIDVFRERLAYPDLRRRAVDKAHQYNPDLIIVESASSGLSLYQDLYRYTDLNIKQYTPKGDKEARMWPCTAIMESGRVYLPEEASWLAEFRREMLQFPNSKFDDQADSVSQFFFWARDKDLGGDELTMNISAITSGGRVFRF